MMMMIGGFPPDETWNVDGAWCPEPSPLKMTRRGVPYTGQMGPCPGVEEGVAGMSPGMQVVLARCRSLHRDDQHSRPPHGTTASKLQQESGPAGKRGYPRDPDEPRGSPSCDEMTPEQDAHRMPDKHRKCPCGIGKGDWGEHPRNQCQGGYAHESVTANACNSLESKGMMATASIAVYPCNDSHKRKVTLSVHAHGVCHGTFCQAWACAQVMTTKAKEIGRVKTL